MEFQEKSKKDFESFKEYEKTIIADITDSVCITILE